MNIETILSKISGGKNLDSGAVSTGGSKPVIDDLVRGALGGLTRHESIYLFWTYLDDQSQKLAMKSMLNLVASKQGTDVKPEIQLRVVNLVLRGIQGATLQPCKTCSATGLHKGAVCETCGGLGKVSISKRAIARELNIPWATFYKNKNILNLYSLLMQFCSTLDQNCKNHIYKELAS